VREAPADNVTLSWLLDHLRSRSFGIVLLLLGVCGLIPVVSPVAGLALAIPAFQMIRADAVPIFPRKVAQRPLAAEKFTGTLTRVIPTLRYPERFVRPRWSTPFETTKRVIGVFVLLLGLGLLVPLPLSNIPVGLVIVLVAFAYLEEDGILLAISLMIALALVAAGTLVLWTTITTTASIGK
jgi:hypothetical protein